MKRFLVCLLVAELFFKIQYFSCIPSNLRPKDVLSQTTSFLTGGSYFTEYRGQKILFQKPAHAARVIVYMEPVPTEDQSDRGTWPFFLRQLFSAYVTDEFYAVEVLNFAQPESQPGTLFLSNPTQFNPDLVVVTTPVELGKQSTYLETAVRHSALINFLYTCYQRMQSQTAVTTARPADLATMQTYLTQQSIPQLWILTPGQESTVGNSGIPLLDYRVALADLPDKFKFGVEQNRLSVEAEHYLAVEVMDWMMAQRIINNPNVAPSYSEFMNRFNAFHFSGDGDLNLVRREYYKSIMERQFVK